MAESAATQPINLQGLVKYNEQLITLPSPMSFQAMQERYGGIQIKNLRIGKSDNRMQGSEMAFNELLDSSVEIVPDTTGLHKLWFSAWDESVGEIEPEILAHLVSKCGNLRELFITRMGQAAEPVK